MQKTVVAIGKFDGVHIAHRELLLKAVDIAKINSFKSVGFIISSDKAPLLLTPRAREEEMLSLGLDLCHVQSLDEDFMSMSAEDFLDKVLVGNFNCAHIAVGYNFRFGKGRYADADVLKRLCAERGIGCTVIEKVTCTLKSEVADVSSTKIRECLLSGDAEGACALLGRNYSLSGEVTHGKKIGRTIGIPTANIACDERLILPKSGVYATRAVIGGRGYPSITNIGDNPTVNQGSDITVETNILDFSGDIYGEKIEVEFLKRIRDEKKFSDLSELKNQINSDIEIARESYL